MQNCRDSHYRINTYLSFKSLMPFIYRVPHIITYFVHQKDSNKSLMFVKYVKNVLSLLKEFEAILDVQSIAFYQYLIILVHFISFNVITSTAVSILKILKLS